MRPVIVSRVVRCAAPIDAVWTHVSDTLRLNRAAGMSPLEVTPSPSRGLDRYRLRARLGGFTVTYVERPFAWQKNKYFSFLREMKTGPAARLFTRYELAPGPGGAGCDVTVYVEITPRWTVLRPLVWLATRQTIAAVVEYLDGAGQPPKAVVKLAVDETALRSAAARLSSRHPSGLVSRLVDLLARGDDLDVAPIRPFALAAAWDVERIALLRLCLESVPAGLLELHWGVICPSCHLASQVLPSLSELDGKGHCHACDLRYDTDLDRAVEAQFLPHPSVRSVELRPYCVGGPALTPHVLAQVALEPGSAGEMTAPAQPGRVRIFARGGAIAIVDVVEGASSDVSVRIDPRDVTPSQLSVATQGTVRVENRSGEGRHVKLEETEWLSGSATAHHVATLPEFRSLFGTQALKPGLALKVSSVAILFSDLCGSTALYSRIGDAAAFGVVSDCFAHWSHLIEEGGGAVVKTMGDAVMAAFVDGDAAVATGMRMLADWEAFVRDHPQAASLDLKIGVNVGPCTVVTANGAIDYFGQTVNGAARVLHLAGAHEAILAESLAEALPEEHAPSVERFEARVKGIDEPLRLARIRPVASGAPPAPAQVRSAHVGDSSG